MKLRFDESPNHRREKYDPSQGGNQPSRRREHAHSFAGRNPTYQQHAQYTQKSTLQREYEQVVMQRLARKRVREIPWTHTPQRRLGEKCGQPGLPQSEAAFGGSLRPTVKVVRKARLVVGRTVRYESI